MSLALCVFLEWNGKSLITCQKHCYESSSKNQMGNGKVKDDLLTCKKSSYVLLAHFTSHFNYFVFLNMDTKSTLNNSQSTWPLWKISEILGAIRVKLDLQLLKIFSSFSMISARLPKWKKKKKKKDSWKLSSLGFRGRGRNSATDHFLSDLFVLHGNIQ